MSNYNESQVAGTQWRRASDVHIRNNYGTTPTITFTEERITKLENHIVSQQTSVLTEAFDQAKEIELINPSTGELIGISVTHMELYIMLHSLYIQLAKKRDQLALQTEQPIM